MPPLRRRAPSSADRRARTPPACARSTGPGWSTPSRSKPVGQPAPVVVDRRRAAGPPAAARPPIVPSPSAGKPCSTAFCSTSVSTIASGVADSAGSVPKLPVRPSSPARPGSRPRRPSRRSRSATSSKSTRSSNAWLSVSCTIAIDPTRRTASSSAAAPLGHVHPPGLQPQQRGHRLQVVLHPVVDLPDRGVLGDQLAVAAAQLGDVAQQHERADVLARADAAGSTRTISDRPVGADLGVTGRRPPSDSAQRLLVGAPRGGTSSAVAGRAPARSGPRSARAGGRPTARSGWRR